MPQEKDRKTPATPGSAPEADGGGRHEARALTVVGIGASAGGLEACRRLVTLLPVDPTVAFILIQHLDPTHESMMVALLAGHTAMPVRQAGDGMALEGGAIFVIPPGVYLGISDGALRVTAPTARHGARLPFDHLLHALAKACGARAVCVVLSGTGADGAQGLRSVHDAGGLVIAQDPSEAEYDGMPQSAIATGMVDLVLPLAQMPAALAEAARGGSAQRATRPAAAPQDAALAQIIALLRAETRHDFSLYKTGTLLRRLARRMAAADPDADPEADGGMAAYLERLRGDAQERDMLARDLLIHVTSFFRDPEVFEHLAASVAPELIAQTPPDRPLRIWVAGCSTGEEAYSLGMAFFEALATKPEAKVQILASDADPEAIAAAREGLYPEAAVAQLSPARLARFFVREDGGYRVIASLRDAVVFTVHDLLKDPPFSRIDLVSCRNVMIYLGHEAQARAVSLFHFALRPGGVLLLGASETAGPADGRFEPIDKLARLYRRVGRSRAGDVAFLLGDGARAPARLSAGQTPKRQDALGDLCRTALLDAYAPTAVLINRRFECLHFAGPTGRYLRIPSGAPSQDFLAIAPPAQRSRIRAAAQRAFETRALATVTGGTVGEGVGAESFSIEMRPVEVEGEALVLACFVAAPPPAMRASDAAGGPGRIAALERELDITRTELRGAIHTLETASEEQASVHAEALSVSEEYQSTNEELLASKEELQSLNEELTALNGQLQETLERHRTAAADLQNVLYSTDVATLCLDMDLRIRFFTPAARTLFSVIATDVGRPLSDLAAHFRDDALEADARAVLGGAEAQGREVLSETGSWHMRCVRPYRTGDGRIEGVVITFADITERKHAAEALEAARRLADHANLAKSRFLAAASHDLRQPLQSLTLIHGLLAKSVATAQGRTLLARFNETLGVMASMLNALLDINEIESGVVQPTLADFPLGPLLERLRDEFGYLAQERGLSLKAAPTTAVVRSDARLMEQMLRNLIANALKYTEKGGVLIGCRRRGAHVCVEVRDTGVGIAGAELDTIFDEYHQLDNPARERGRGLGLGLSIVKRLGLMLDHPVTVRSTPRRGSVFTICAPRAQDAAAAAPAGEAPLAAARDAAPGVVARQAAPATILLIDDDDTVRDLIEQLLLAEGHTVIAACDGASAMRRVMEDGLRPDLALIDYNLPDGMHGLDVAARLRAHLGSGLPVVVLTGDISAATLRAVRAARCARLSKPVAPATLFAVIAALAGAARENPATPRPPCGDSRATVFVVDDDAGVRADLRSVLEDGGWAVRDYATAEALLADRTPGPGGCLLVDAHLPGMSGIELLEALRARGAAAPAVMITGAGDVAMAIAAMRAGALDFIEKPVRPAALLASLGHAVEQSRDAARSDDWRRAAAARLDALTPRQRQIMAMVLDGRANKVIAADLGVSQRTVENHRAAVMRKTGAASLPALARLALIAARGGA